MTEFLMHSASRCSLIKVMPTKTTLSRNPDPVMQFSVFTPNRLGRLHDLISVLGSHGIHVLALAVMDTTDCAIIRLVVDDPDKARGLLLNEGFPFSETKLLVVEIDSTFFDQREQRDRRHNLRHRKDTERRVLSHRCFRGDIAEPDRAVRSDRSISRD